MAYWILKTEPSAYSFDRLEQDGTAVWDGVANNLALKHLRAMHPGDEALIYHTGEERSLIGKAVVTSEPYADPKLKDPKRAVVELRAAGRLAHPVPLATIKATPALKELPLVRLGRLSVSPATPAEWRELLRLAK